MPDVPTVVAFAGPSGEFITQGRSYQYTPPNSLITIQEDTGQAGACPGASLAPGGHITVHVRASTVWMIDLASPSGQPLAPWTYSRVDRYPFCNPKVGGFALIGDGRACNTLTADFTIRELTLSPDGSIAHLDVRFDQSCERSVSLARGAIRYQATVPA